MKRYIGIALMIIGGFTLASMIGLTRLLSDKTAVDELVEATPKIVRGAKEEIFGPSPKTYPDVEAWKDRAQHLSELITAVGGYNQIYAKAHEWPEVRLISTKSPLIRFDMKDVEAKRYSPKVVVTTPEGENEIGLADELPPDTRIEYWDVNRSIRVDLASIVNEPGLPAVVVPAAQRSSDGRYHVTEWVYLEDVALPEQLPAAPWGRVKLRNNFEYTDKGSREIIDRYAVVLKRGQSSEQLAYQAPFKDEYEQRMKAGWKLGWQLVCDETLSVKVNGDLYIFIPNQYTDTSESRSPSGSVILEVTLTSGSKQTEAPVEFIFYWHMEGVG